MIKVISLTLPTLSLSLLFLLPLLFNHLKLTDYFTMYDQRIYSTLLRIVYLSLTLLGYSSIYSSLYYSSSLYQGRYQQATTTRRLEYSSPACLFLFQHKQTLRSVSLSELQYSTSAEGLYFLLHSHLAFSLDSKKTDSKVETVSICLNRADKTGLFPCSMLNQYSILQTEL